MSDLMNTLGQQSKRAAQQLSQLESAEKNDCLMQMAQDLENSSNTILAANQQDLSRAKENGIPNPMIDRLRLTGERIKEMAEGIRQVASLPDPIGVVEKMWRTEDQLMVGQQRVPLGVIGIIFESRPNVTTDAASLCFKSGNTVILRGGKEAFYSNQALVELMQQTLRHSQLDPAMIQFVNDTSHDVANEMMRLNEYLDVLIPRGGAGLIQRVKNSATVPVIETGTGNNHVYVDHAAQLDMAISIVANAKAQRPSVCNAIETLLVHEDIASEFLPMIEEALTPHQVALRADSRAMSYLKQADLATEADWATEFLDYILAIKVVASIDEAIEHINRFNSKHSEAIITDSYHNGQRFLKEVDAAAVYINASTRFTDGFKFGFGAEIGISTQKLHARGPMGLEHLTSTKYIIYGDGQIRE
ncbi:glutamate-5-semialdehyde dehydrogenase [Enterococcus malodoratus]|uniref:Gamma-glutamyl phosphate reductase n=1 Tax=Enterococcus malodoratus ATCC 43197 TaxID=1158601 RepID=R2PA06_9ENTE|nr:glutamate-5-semialdehyde dehydrogenase [Enterococcus malodoratus]EOH81122.1 glutamate-5-semialdehyde dehydrogenase [Enterococcus malodoratus ATCC 43197]EOT69632.1 glutamate-5-semialdehyde dehydrogenase [Enterococcus malodoratus ATCC 43197]SPX01271.1 gamma-glutamyl phosphate reductase [Enterococcus malodoratus]STC71015.1 gamma-glutamyl phosphate reductase [Enterococcus malodoratus]